MDILLTELQFDDIAIRKKAASYINRLSRGAWTDKNKECLTNGKTISILIDAIEQEIDEKILLDLLNTVGSISQRYEYYDLRILETLVPFYDHASICIKVEACTKTLQFNDPRTWHAIYKIFEHKTTKKQISYLDCS